jgi:hypothetical protein
MAGQSRIKVSRREGELGGIVASSGQGSFERKDRVACVVASSSKPVSRALSPAFSDRFMPRPWPEHAKEERNKGR